MGTGDAVPLLETPRGGTNILSGFAVATGEVGPRVAGVLWRGGPGSLIDDINFPRGRGRLNAVLAPAYPKQPSALTDNPANKGSQYPSLWIRDGGGGFIRDVWTANTMARAGWRVEHTSTPGTAYQVSCEHHPHNEVQFLHAAHWTVYALQTIQLDAFAVGGSRLVASEDDDKVYRVRLENSTHLASNVFAPRAGTSVVEDIAGNVYVAGAQVFVYDSGSHLMGTLEVPERPSGLVFGGPKGDTLFIGARSGLYVIRTVAHER